MKVTADRVVETHHYNRHIALSGGPVIKMRKQNLAFRVTHINITWEANKGTTPTVMVRGPHVVKKGKKYKRVKRGYTYCRRSYNNPKKLPKWLLEVVLEGAKLNADTARRKQEGKAVDQTAVQTEKTAVG